MYDISDNFSIKPKIMIDLLLFSLPHTVQKTVVGVSLNATRASPKSHIFNLQLEFAKMFLGFRSR
jgi:hypothetical protein